MVSVRGFAASVGSQGACAAPQALAGWGYKCCPSLVGQPLAPDTAKCSSGPVEHKHLHQWLCPAYREINGGVLIAALASA